MRDKIAALSNMFGKANFAAVLILAVVILSVAEISAQDRRESLGVGRRAVIMGLVGEVDRKMGRNIYAEL
jgi:hypothetical protein